MWRLSSHDHSTSRRHYYLLINIIFRPPSILIITLHFVLWLMIFVCLHLCSCWCVLLIFFHLGLLLIIFFARTCYLLRGIFSFTWWPTPTDLYSSIHLARVLCWRASLHTEMLISGGLCWLDDVQRFPPRKWRHFGDPDESNNMLPLILFITPSWSCALRRHASFLAVSRCIDDKSRRT